MQCYNCLSLSLHYDYKSYFQKQKAVCVLQVGAPAQIHLTEQFVICGFLYEVVDMSLYGQWQTQNFVPVLNYSLQTLLNVTHVGFSLEDA